MHLLRIAPAAARGGTEFSSS